MKLRALAPALLLAATPATATTIAPPRDLGELLRMSDAVAFAEARASWTERGRSVPLTVTRFVLIRSIAGGDIPWTFEVEELGGDFEDVHFAVEGSPRYEKDRKYLLFLDQGHNRRWRSRIMAYGLLVEEPRLGLLRPLREAKGLRIAGLDGYEAPSTYRRDALLDHLEAVSGGERWDATKVTDLRSVWEETHNDPANCVWLLSSMDSLPLRDFAFASGGTLTIAATTPGQTGIADGGVGAVHAAVSAWTADAGSNINYLRAATQAAGIPPCTGAFDISLGQAIFNDPCGDIPPLGGMGGCTGTLGFGGAFATGATFAFGGEQWHDITSPFLVVNDGAQCTGTTGFNEMMAHEIGHSLGFGHHTDVNALMDGLLHNPAVGAILQATDKACANYAYPAAGNGSAPVRRQELAALMLRAFVGASYNPPCSNGTFTDVTCGMTPYATFINDLDVRNISAGCNAVGPQFCPLDVVTREEAAMLWLKTIGIAQDPCGGGTGYSDISCAEPYGPWVKELRDRGYTLGCNTANTLYCPKDALTYDELSLFITRALFPAPPGTP